MKYNLFAITVSLLVIFSACKNDPTESDLTLDIVGTYRGTLTLNLGTDSIQDVENQVITIEKIDDENVRVIPINYPDQSPVDTLILSANLTPTPLGFIRSEGVMLTFDLLDYNQGTINGTAFLANIANNVGEHGKYDRATGNLVFALEVTKNGQICYELFDGQAQ